MVSVRLPAKGSRSVQHSVCPVLQVTRVQAGLILVCVQLVQFQRRALLIAAGVGVWDISHGLGRLSASLADLGGIHMVPMATVLAACAPVVTFATVVRRLLTVGTSMRAVTRPYASTAQPATGAREVFSVPSVRMGHMQVGVTVCAIIAHLDTTLQRQIPHNSS